MAKPKSEEVVNNFGEKSEQMAVDPFESLRGSGQEFRLSWQRTAPFHARGHLSPSNVAWSADAIDDVIPFMAEQFGGGSFMMGVKVPNVNGSGFRFLRHIPIDISGQPKMQGAAAPAPPTTGYQAPQAQQMMPYPIPGTGYQSSSDPTRQLMSMLQPMLGALMERLLQPAAPGAAPPIADVASLVQTLAGTVQRASAPADPFEMFERTLNMVSKMNQVTGRQERSHASAAAPASEDGMPSWVMALLPLAERVLISRQSNPAASPRPAGPPLPRGLSWDQSLQKWVLAPGADVFVKRAKNPSENAQVGDEIEEKSSQDSSNSEGEELDSDEEEVDAPIETADEALEEISAIVQGLPEAEQKKLMATWSAMNG